ncbi:MAG TPA: hypothetical protein VEK76_04120 [Candidatus Binatia bacterium]|nr:hypothetical protein [Candidatus Binatia bacterium]
MQLSVSLRVGRGRAWALLAGTAFILVGATTGAAPATAASPGSGVPYGVTRGQLTAAGAVNLRSLAAQQGGAMVPSPTTAGRYRAVDNQAVTYQPGRRSAALSATANFPVSSLQVPGESGFIGLTGPQQAAVNGDLDLEPPDQGLCAGQGLVGEFINNAFDVYTPSGVAEEAPVPSFAIFNQPADSFFSDPRCYYDAPTQRWILIEFVITVNSVLQVIPPATQFIAVSNTFDPLGTYNIYSFDTTDASTPNCPCFGDFDQLGVDDNGIYISTNEFGDASGYNGVIIYALSKQLLETEKQTGISPTLFEYRLPSDFFGAPYHIAPAQTPPGAKFAPNTEYFVESNSNAASDDHLAVYAMIDTSLLATPAPPPLLSTEIVSEAYAFPPDATQMKGPHPLGAAGQDPEGELQADFNAIQEVTYTGGQLLAELDTNTAAGRDGTAWFVLSASHTTKKLSASLVRQGYVTVAGENLIYPDIAVDSAGGGYIGFTLSGAGYFPSAAYVAFDSAVGAFGSIHVAMAGTAPEDSFTCYAAFVGPSYGGCRWGDYSMGVAMNGRVYLATEVVPPTSRDYLTNWGTYVWSAKPMAPPPAS